MALPLFVYVVGSALAGALGYATWDKAHQKKLADDAARQSAASMSAKELIKGKSYIVQLMVDPKQSQWGGVRDLATAQQLIQRTFEQLGWRFLMSPTPREDSKTAAAKLQNLQPLEWVFNAQWMLDQKTQPMSPNWVGMAVPYLLPSS
jgi:hypothetical protein